MGRSFKDVPEYFVPPPPGRYPSVCVLATAYGENNEPLLTKAKDGKGGGFTQVKVTWEIADGQFKGAQADDYIGTDPGAKGAGVNKVKLRALGFDVDTEAGLPDDPVIAQTILGRHMVIEYGNEALTTKESNFKEPMTVIDHRTGQTITLQKLRIKGYVPAIAAPTGHAAPVINTGAPQWQGQAPVQQLQAPVQQYAPAQFQPQMQVMQPQTMQAPQMQIPPGFALNAQGQLVQVQQLTQAQPTQAAPQQYYQQPVQGAVPAGWPPNGAPAVGADTTKKASKKLKIEDQA